jgi:hypothetical protein
MCMGKKSLTDVALDVIKKRDPLIEMTATNGAGVFSIPLTPGTRLWNKDTLKPFTNQVSKYDDAQLAFDSYDGKIDVSKNKASKMEKNEFLSMLKIILPLMMMMGII